MNDNYIADHLLPALRHLGIDCHMEGARHLVLPGDGSSADIRLMARGDDHWSFMSRSPWKVQAQLAGPGGWVTDAHGSLFAMLWRLRCARGSLRAHPLYRVAAALTGTGFMKHAELRWDGEELCAWWLLPTYKSPRADVPPGHVDVRATEDGLAAWFSPSDDCVAWLGNLDDQPPSGDEATPQPTTRALFRAISHSYGQGAERAQGGAAQ